MVLHSRRQPEPAMHRLFPDRIAGRWKGRRVKRTHSYPADGEVAISLPIERASAIRAEMKSNLITAVGVALVNLPLPIEPHLLFRKTCAEMESGTGAALACLTVAQVHPIRFTRGNYSKRAAVALPGSFHRSPPAVIGGHFGRFLRLPSSRFQRKTVRADQYRRWSRCGVRDKNLGWVGPDD